MGRLFFTNPLIAFSFKNHLQNPKNSDIEHMNRTLFLFISLTIFLFLAISCQKQQNIVRKKYTIGFSQCTTGDSWRRRMHETMKQELMNSDKINLIVKDAKDNSQLQFQHIKEFLEMEVDLLIVSPNEIEPVTPAITEIFYQGIPVIIVDRRMNSNLYTAFVGADNYRIGQSAGQHIRATLDGKGKVIEIWGLRGSSPAVDRHQGFVEVLEDSDIEIVTEVDGFWEKENVLQNLPAILAQHQDLDLIFAHNDRMAIGAYLVCKDMGLEDSIRIVGIDGLPGSSGGLQYVEDGLLDATVFYPTGGKEIIELTKRILNNQPFEKENILETTLITKENVGIFKSQITRIMSQQQALQQEQVAVKEVEQRLKSRNILLVLSSFLLLSSIIWGIYIYRNAQERLRSIHALEIQNKQILQQHQNVLGAISKKKTPSATPSQDFVTQFKTLVEANLDNSEFSIKDICKALGVSRIQLYRKVKTNLNCSANDYIQNTRLTKAKKLLETTETSISDIAYQVGYTSPSYFSTAFKAKFKKSPSDFRVRT